ncbi:hypothetical protein ZWY2020_003025 [Hordeum vulgare]|nr:hypothetical protein ZWY2020_003025 [Hordeum vulgare]
MGELGLTEENLQDVMVDDDELSQEATRWMALARVNTNRIYSQYWFYRNMKAAWDLAHDVKIRPLEENLYTMQFLCLGDWERVMAEGPWTHKGKAVVLAHYDGFTKPSTIALDKIDIWIQIHGLPDGFYPMIKALSSTAGEYISAEPKSPDFEGNFFRVRAKIDVTEPLKNDASLVIRKKREIFRVKYERLPDWCAVCGMLGHMFKECGDGIHDPKKLVFKDLRAVWFRGAGQGPGEGRGSRGGRGRGRTGRGGARGFTHPSQNTDTDCGSEDDLHDATMEEAENSKKRGQPPITMPKNIPLLGQGPCNNLSAIPPSNSPLSPSLKQEQKRIKNNQAMVGKNNTTNNTNDAHLAGPNQGSRRVQ